MASINDRVPHGNEIRRSPMHMMVTAADQQLGGLLMWVVGSLFLLVFVSSILFLRWMFQQEKEQQEREQIHDHEIGLAFRLRGSNRTSEEVP